MPLLAGSLAVAFLLAGTRWASYLGSPPIFITDMLLAAAFIHHGTTRLVKPREPVQGVGRRGDVLLKLLLLWACVRFAFGGDVSQPALRDFAPYLYVAVGLLAAWSLRTASDATRHRTSRFLVKALTFHALWFTTAVLFPTLSTAMPFGIFVFRPDIDTALNGVLAAILIVRLVLGRARRVGRSVCMIAVCFTGVLVSQTRAGLLAAVLAVMFAVAVGLSAPGAKRRQAVTVAVIPLLAVGFVLAFPQTTVGSRLVGGLTGASTTAALSAEGTTNARANTWDYLFHWIERDESTRLIGVGFGPNFMADSGAIHDLVGYGNPDADEVRSPHDYWLGTLARLGWPGAILAALAALKGLRRIWAARTLAADDELRLVASLVVLAILPIASLGVVLEAPFGAVPFWWCVGLVLALPRTLTEKPRPAVRQARPMRVNATLLHRS